MHFESKVGHIGGNLSVLQILLNLLHVNMQATDHLVLSKGHSAGALYIALWTKGVLKDEQLKTFHKDGTLLSGHPAPNSFENIPFATGSLGHGFSLAAGMALGHKLAGKSGKIFCVTSDGEWNEGSSWEALIFAAHHRLNNLVIIIDRNHLQGFGGTEEIAKLGDMEKKFSQFDIAVETIDGHNWEELSKSMKPDSNRLKIVIAKTTKGKGVSFMENKMEWHYLPMSEQQFHIAMQELKL